MLDNKQKLASASLTIAKTIQSITKNGAICYLSALARFMGVNQNSFSPSQKNYKSAGLKYLLQESMVAKSFEHDRATSPAYFRLLVPLEDIEAHFSSKKQNKPAERKPGRVKLKGIKTVDVPETAMVKSGKPKSMNIDVPGGVKLTINF